jgi:hypothetical protein
MVKPLLFLFVLFLAATASAVEPLWEESFEALATPGLQKDVVPVPGRGGVLRVAVAPGTTNPGRVISLPLPLEKLRGRKIYFGAEVKTAGISHKPNPWNGVKVMLVIQAASGTTYPQPEVPDGSGDWQRFSTWVSVPENATNAWLVLGLEQVTGEATWAWNRSPARRGLITPASCSSQAFAPRARRTPPALSFEAMSFPGSVARWRAPI